MIVSLPDSAVARLVDLALADTGGVDAARKALAGFCDKRTTADALNLLAELVAELTTTTTGEPR